VIDSDSDIRSIRPDDEERIAELCSLLVDSFRELSPGWVPTAERAREVVDEALAPEHINRILVSNDRLVGWVGLRPDYGAVWELHPLVVDPAVRRRGYGRKLVDAAEMLAAEQGALTLVLGTSDEIGLTSLANKDLFLDPLSALQELKAAASHPVGFWLNVGFTIIGVVPDAEGPGKPTILLAKRLMRRA
jgi:aminoglycoside 6'-N-acetyltransferase I